MYRNYDGNKSVFGDTSVSASGPNPDDVAVFAATRKSDAALTVMIVNKYLDGATPVALSVNNFLSSGPAQVWQLNSSNTIVRLSDVAVSAGKVNLTVPSPSITLLVFGAKQFTLRATGASPGGNVYLSLTGEIGQTYVIQSSTNLTSWQPIATNALSSTQINLAFPDTASRNFYRAVRTQ